MEVSVQQEQARDVIAAAQEILSLVHSFPPHVRPWLREIEAAAEHIHLEVVAVDKRASARFLTWLLAGLSDEVAEEVPA
jgi:hypothetical protein